MSEVLYALSMFVKVLFHRCDTFFFKVSVACLLVFCAIYFDELEADLEAICVYQDMQ